MCDSLLLDPFHKTNLTNPWVKPKDLSKVQLLGRL